MDFVYSLGFDVLGRAIYRSQGGRGFPTSSRSPAQPCSGFYKAFLYSIPFHAQGTLEGYTQFPPPHMEARQQSSLQGRCSLDRHEEIREPWKYATSQQCCEGGRAFLRCARSLESADGPLTCLQAKLRLPLTWFLAEEWWIGTQKILLRILPLTVILGKSPKYWPAPASQDC